MRKILSVIMIAVMILAMSTTAFASNDHAHKITITGNDGHNYTAYQVFQGDISAGKLTNIEWGNGVDKEALAAELVTLPAYSDLADELYASEKGADAITEGVAEILQGFVNDSAEIEAFAAIVAKHITTKAGESTETAATDGDSVYEILVHGDGYYFIKDETSKIPQGDSVSEYVLKVMGNVSVTAKEGDVTSEKKVKDKDDTTGEFSGWQDSADYDIGDYIPFQLKATLPENYDQYTSYSMTFHDYEWEYADGEQTKSPLELVFEDSNYPFVVKVDGEVISKDLYRVLVTGNDHCTFEVVIPSVKAITAAENNSVITVEYYSKLVDTANLGALGNKNSMFVTYTNDVYQEGEKGQTKEDTVIIFTYQTVINKVDQNGAALAGAEFELQKQIGKTESSDGSWITIAAVKNDAGTTFTFKGLDDGNYKLVETKEPAGYNKMDDIFFTVTASHDIESDNPALTSLSGKVPTGEITFVASDDFGTLSTAVENRQGATLPSTGGIGTTIFYIAGIILVLAAAVLFVTKRRVGVEK